MPLSSHLLVSLAAGSSGGSSGGGGSGLLSFLPLLLIVAVGYLLLIRPARARQRKALENRSAVAVGTEVTTTAGLIATVVAVDDDTVTLEVAPGVHSRYLKGAIARVNTPFEPEPDDAGPSTPADPPEAEQIHPEQTEH